MAGAPLAEPAPTAEPAPKFLLVQALRGIAAAWVVLFHIARSGGIAALLAELPGWLATALFYDGSAGVAVFFVLSGFVIAHSLLGRPLDGRGFARFALRRSVRLDPPYWAALALAVAMSAWFARGRGMGAALPSAGTVLGHLLYLQEILRLPEIGPVFWTLAYEVQFYLVLALALYLVTVAMRRGARAETAYRGLFALLAVPAFVAAASAREWAPHGLFLNLWHGFFAGVLAYEAGWRRRSPLPLLALAGVMLVGATRADGVFATPCALTALLLFAAARSGWIVRGLGGAAWQWLGRISYSLYLVHAPAIAAGFALAGRLRLGQGTPVLLLMLALCLAAAGLFWWAIERPSHAIARRLPA